MAEDKNKMIIRIKKQGVPLEKQFAEIKSLFTELKEGCKDRTRTSFPVETVQEIIKSLQKFAENIKDIEIPREYLESVAKFKTPVKYFEEKIREVEDVEEEFERKRGIFSYFGERLEELKKEHLPEELDRNRRREELKKDHSN